MVRLREIPRTAAFAWSPGSSKALVVTGTRAGAVSDDFSTETKLELWDLGLDNQARSVELQPVAIVDADSRLYSHAPGPRLLCMLISGAVDSMISHGAPPWKNTPRESLPAPLKMAPSIYGMLRSLFRAKESP